MRIELNAGGLGRSTVTDFQDRLNALISEADNNAEAFGTVKNAVYNLNGGVANMQHAMELLHTRETQEQGRKEYLQNVASHYSDFLNLAFTTDSQVGAIFDISQYIKNVGPSLSDIIDHIGDAIDGLNKGLGLGVIAGAAEIGKSIIDSVFGDNHDVAVPICALPDELSEEGKEKGPWAPSWKSGSVSGETTVFGVDAKGEAKGEVFGASKTGKVVSEWNKTKGNMATYASGEIEGHILKGSASGNIGYLKGSAEGSVGNASVKGNVGVSLMRDGKIAPSLGAEVIAEVSGAKGKADVAFGTDDYDVHAAADGKLGVAKAYANAGVGRLTYKDDQGGVHTAWGAAAGAGAEAYAAEGSVKGGVNIAGLKINVGVSGKAGGAGAKVGGQVSTSNLNGEVGLGLGVGVGLKVDIDWSNFKPSKLLPWNW